MSDEYLASEGVYAEDGYSYLYEIDGNTVRYGMDALTDSRTPEELIAAVEAQIASRTGRADEIGSSQYIDELGKAQAAAQREQAEEPHRPGSIGGPGFFGGGNGGQSERVVGRGGYPAAVPYTAVCVNFL